MGTVKITKDSSELATETYELLRDIGVGALATLNRDGSPHLTVVYYRVDEDFSIVFATKKKTTKHNNMQANDTVQLISFDEQSQATIQVYGNVSEVKDGKATQDIVDDMFWRLKDDVDSTPPVSKLFAGDYIAYTINPKKIVTAIFMRPKHTSNNLFRVLDFTV